MIVGTEIQNEVKERKMRNTPPICKFYLQNRCSHVQSCKYLHGGKCTPYDTEDNTIPRNRSQNESASPRSRLSRTRSLSVRNRLVERIRSPGRDIRGIIGGSEIYERS